MTTLEHRGGVRVLICAKETTIKTDADAGDLISDALGRGAQWIMIPAECFEDDFFRLRTRIAGEIVQKFVIYKRRIAIIGDVSKFVEESTAFRDFVYETNRGVEVWFLATAAEFDERLKRLTS